MALYKSTQVTNMNRNQIPSVDRATDLLPIFGEYVETGSEVSGDIVEMIPFPANHILVDLWLDNQSLAATTATSDVGVMSGAFLDTGARTCGAEFMSAKALATAAFNRMDVTGAGRVAASATDRSIGLKLTTIAGAVTAGRVVRMQALFRPMWEGV